MAKINKYWGLVAVGALTAAAAGAIAALVSRRSVCEEDFEDDFEDDDIDDNDVYVKKTNQFLFSFHPKRTACTGHTGAGGSNYFSLFYYPNSGTFFEIATANAPGPI